MERILFLGLTLLFATPSQAQGGLPAGLDSLAQWERPEERVTRLTGAAAGDTAVVYRFPAVTDWLARVGGEVWAACPDSGAPAFRVSDFFSDARAMVLSVTGSTEQSNRHRLFRRRYLCIIGFSSHRERVE